MISRSESLTLSLTLSVECGLDSLCLSIMRRVKRRVNYFFFVVEAEAKPKFLESLLCQRDAASGNSFKEVSLFENG
jgi:hypothetical protein